MFVCFGGSAGGGGAVPGVRSGATACTARRLQVGVRERRDASKRCGTSKSSDASTRLTFALLKRSVMIPMSTLARQQTMKLSGVHCVVLVTCVKRTCCTRLFLEEYKTKAPPEYSSIMLLQTEGVE